MYKSIKEKRTPKVFCNLSTGEVTDINSSKNNYWNNKINNMKDLITRTQRLDRRKKKTLTKLVRVRGAGLFKSFVRINK